MTKDEALRLALEALERCVATCFDQYAHEEVMSRPDHFVNQTITSIKAALEEKDEPLTENGMYRLGYHNGYGFGEAYGKANAPQRTWVGLTKEERHEISMANRPYVADAMAAHEEELKRRNT